jgi:hypothetical protein
MATNRLATTSIWGPTKVLAAKNSRVAANTVKAVVLSMIAAGSLIGAPAQSREAASPVACKAAAAEAPILDAKSVLDNSPNDLRAHFALADAWSDAGCFSEAVQVLLLAENLHSGSKELETRLRVAKSLIGEENFFDDLDRANADAKLKRAIFRCTSLADTAACAEAVAMRPADASLRSAQVAALQRAQTAAPSPIATTLGAAASPAQATSNLTIARAPHGATPARRYSNAPTESQSH